MFEPNPLSDYESYTYHISLILSAQTQGSQPGVPGSSTPSSIPSSGSAGAAGTNTTLPVSSTAIQDRQPMSVESLANMANGAISKAEATGSTSVSASPMGVVGGSTTGVVVAETGKTSNFYIDKLEFETITPGKETTLPSSIVSATVVVLEPLGFTFFDRYFSAMENLGWQNPGEAVFYLQIAFNGWLPNGLPHPRSYSTILRCKVTDIACELDSGQSRYIIQLNGMENLALANDVVTTERQFACEIKKTLSGTISEFEKEFNKSATGKQNAGNASTGSDDVYKFEMGPRLSQVNPEMNTEIEADSTTVQKNTESKTMFYYSGEPVTQALIKLCMNAKNIAKEIWPNLDSNGKMDTSQPPSGDLAKYFNIRTEVSYGSFNSSEGHYQRIYKYIVDLVPHPEIEKVPPGATPEAVSRANSYISSGLLKKRYDYFFTGKNTEVLGVNIDFNAMFSQIITSYTRPQKEYGPNITEEGRNTEINLSDLTSGLFGSFPQTLTNFLSGLSPLSVGGRYLEQYAATKSISQMINYRTRPLAAPERVRSGVAAIDTPEHNAQAVAVSHADKETYYQPPVGLIGITMEIRGDPYWIDGGTPGQYLGDNGSVYTYYKANIGEPAHEYTGLPYQIGKVTFSGIYQVISVTSTFESGRFVQKMNLVYDISTIGIDFP